MLKTLITAASLISLCAGVMLGAEKTVVPVASPPPPGAPGFRVIEFSKVRDLTVNGPKGRNITGASGLVVLGTTAYVISDDGLDLFGVQLRPGKADIVAPLFGGTLPQDATEVKKSKPDSETLVQIRNALLVIPSFSTEQRMKGALVPLDSGNLPLPPTAMNWRAAFEAIKPLFPETNIEGGVFRQNTLRLFQRGNGASAQNGFIDLNLDVFLAIGRGQSKDTTSLVTAAVPVNLPRLRGVPLGISDAALLPSGKILFLASAEDAASTYADGRVIGTVIGLMEWSGKFRILGEISPVMKGEGIAVIKASAEEAEVMVVPDPDDPAKVSALWSATIRLN